MARRRFRLSGDGACYKRGVVRRPPAHAALIAASLALAVLFYPAGAARAFGDAGAFDPRVLLTGTQAGPAHPTAPARWAWELVQRTSAPARLHPTVIHADDPAIVDAPFLFWSGDAEVAPLTSAEIAGLRRFFALGGLMLVDDSAPGGKGEPSAFGVSARREIARVLPDSAPIGIGTDHVVFRTFYFLRRAMGRVQGPPSLDAIVRGGQVQVLFSEHDIGGALARGASGMWESPVVPGGDLQREAAIRLAVNIAMYVLCSNYKDDQVHAPYLMRRRALSSP
jgi:hypothetical protein